MKLIGAQVAKSSAEVAREDVYISRGRIVPFANTGKRAVEIDLSGCLLLPGLINGHDHLEFNLFPRLDSGFHANYVDWAASVFHPNQEPIRSHLRLPKHVRLRWGGLKNLLSGVTTVSHHNPYDPVFAAEFPVRVARRFGWAHSIQFAPDFETRCRDTPPDWPFLIHAGEGTDDFAHNEIGRLHRRGVLCERTVLIHAVALEKQTLEMLRQTGAGVVWCPSSNLQTIAQTLGPKVLTSGLPIALGTDSALTALGDLIDEFSVVKRLGHVTDSDVYEMVTSVPAQLLRLRNGEGEIRMGGVADLLAVFYNQSSPASALDQLRPQLVIVGGKVKLVAARFAERLPASITAPLERICLEGRGEYLVDAPVAELLAISRRFLLEGIALAGRRVAA
ncbi:MAG: amidohydrolase family protein [Bryobacteraceae bacterium]